MDMASLSKQSSSYCQFGRSRQGRRNWSWWHLRANVYWVWRALVNDQTSGTYGVMNGGNMTAAQAADYAKTVNNPNAANTARSSTGPRHCPARKRMQDDERSAGHKDISSGNYAAAFAWLNSTGGGAYLLHGATLSGFGGDSINTSQQYAAFYAAAQPYIASSVAHHQAALEVGGGGGPSDLNTEWGNDTSTSATTDYNTTKGGKEQIQI